MGNFISNTMSRKRPSPESSDDVNTNNGTDPVFQSEDNTKRAKLWTSSDALLQSLPIELIECILVKAVAMEVMDMKLVKSTWKEKADLVINRLSAVSPQWSNLLMSNFFRNELHRTLDRTAEKKVRLEILHQFPLQILVSSITTTKDEVFLLCFPKEAVGITEDAHVIHVYERDNLVEVKDVIPLPGILAYSIAACRVSNSIYVLSELGNRSIFHNVLRITKDDQGQFKISPLISKLKLPFPNLSVTADGGLILSTWQPRWAVSLYNANGSLQRDIWNLPKYVSYGIVPKSNGNLVVVSCKGSTWQTKLTEIDMDGNILREYQTSSLVFCTLCQIDKYGRMLLAHPDDTIQLLDSEFNLLDFAYSQLDESKAIVPHLLHYNSERDEVVTVLGDPSDELTICRFTDE